MGLQGDRVNLHVFAKSRVFCCVVTIDNLYVKFFTFQKNWVDIIVTFCIVIDLPKGSGLYVHHDDLRISEPTVSE